MEYKFEILEKSEFFNKISTKGDGNEDYQVVTLNIDGKIESFYIKVYSVEGRKINGKDGETISRQILSQKYDGILIEQTIKIEPRDLEEG